MKIKWYKKRDRALLGRRGKKCSQCGESIEKGGHFIPATGEWLCRDYRNLDGSKII